MKNWPCGCTTEWFEDPDDLCVPCLVIRPCDMHRREAADRRDRRARADFN